MAELTGHGGDQLNSMMIKTLACTVQMHFLLCISAYIYTQEKSVGIINKIVEEIS